MLAAGMSRGNARLRVLGYLWVIARRRDKVVLSLSQGPLSGTIHLSRDCDQCPLPGLAGKGFFVFKAIRP